MIVFLLPLYCIFFHYRPEDRGLKPYGDSGLHASRESMEYGIDGRDAESRDWALPTAVRTRQFWLIVLSQFLFWGIGVYLVMAHQVNFAVAAGYSSMFSASVLALFGIFMVFGQLSVYTYNVHLVVPFVKGTLKIDRHL